MTLINLRQRVRFKGLDSKQTQQVQLYSNQQIKQNLYED